MKATLKCFMLLVASSLCATTLAQTTMPKYKVVKTGRHKIVGSLVENDIAEKLNENADQGYRLLVYNWDLIILRLETTPPDTYRYLALETDTGVKQFTNWVNEQGARGYRWRAGTRLMEKAPHPRNYEYQNQMLDYGSITSRFVEQGYRPVDLLSFEHVLGQPTEALFFEREIGLQTVPPEIGAGAGDAVKFASARRSGTLMDRVNSFAGQGYRYLGSVRSHAGRRTSLMMEKCGNCAGRYDYRHFDAKGVAQLERELNAQGKDGFRVLPAALSYPPHLLERDTRQKQSFKYRVLEKKEAADLELALLAADEERFVPLGYVFYEGFSSWGALLVLEKETTASAAP